MAMEAWVVLREGVVGDLIMRAIAYDMMSSLQGRVSDFVYTRAPRRFGRNRALVVLAGVTVPSTGLNDSAEKFAGSGSEDLFTVIGSDRRGGRRLPARSRGTLESFAHCFSTTAGSSFVHGA